MPAEPLAVTVKLPVAPGGEGGAGGAGDRRRLVDGECEGLRGVGADAVVGGDSQGVGAAGAGRRSAGEHGGAGVERDAAGQRPGLSLSAGVGEPLAVTVNVPCGRR